MTAGPTPIKASSASQAQSDAPPRTARALRVWTDEEREVIHEMAKSAPQFDVRDETVRR